MSHYKHSHFTIQGTKAILSKSDGYTMIDAVEVARNLSSLINNSKHFCIVLTVCQVLFLLLESSQHPFEVDTVHYLSFADKEIKATERLNYVAENTQLIRGRAGSRTLAPEFMLLATQVSSF